MPKNQHAIAKRVTLNPTWVTKATHTVLKRLQFLSTGPNFNGAKVLLKAFICEQ